MTQPTEAARLSRILFEAREVAEMHADIVESDSDQPVPNVRRLVVEIDAYRAEQGWSANGFGGEE